MTRTLTRRSVLILAAGLAIAFAMAPGIASAQYREFTGRIDKINKKKMIVDNRQGDKVTFHRTDEGVVEGEKTDWDKLKNKDWVTVSWKFTDKPRLAYKVVVQPRKEDDD